MRDDAFLQAELNQDLADLKPLHPRTVKGALERVLEGERVRAEEPMALKQLSQAVFGAQDIQVKLSDSVLEQILAAKSGEALDQALAQFAKANR
ncbi:MAG: hypothetical protein IV090_19955 [Candidatus Sericytochromatia bacterium]|nr:hypothetical protein [Candidatus Sericytochromatia bacterium]